MCAKNNNIFLKKKMNSERKLRNQHETIDISYSRVKQEK